MTIKIEMADRDLIENDLLLSGYANEAITALTAHLTDEASPVTAESLLRDYRLEMAHSLCSAWLTRRLRVLADGGNPAVAVAALELLVKVSLHGGIQPLTSLNTDFVHNNLR